MRNKMKWRRGAVEHIAQTYITTAEGRWAVEWRAYRAIVGTWHLGLSIGDSGGHLVIACAGTLREIKLMALSAAGQLYHEFRP